MKKITFVAASFLLGGSLFANVIEDINKQYVATDTNQPQNVRAYNRLNYIITEAQKIVDSYTLKSKVDAEIAATNALYEAEVKAKYLTKYPSTKVNINLTCYLTTSNDTFWTEWLAKNPTNDMKLTSVRILKASKRAKEDHVTITTNIVWNSKAERNRYDAFKKTVKKYDVVANLSAEDQATYAEQTANYKQIYPQLKIMKDNCNYMKNYDTITNNAAKAEAKRKAQEAAKKAEKRTLTEEEELRYYEIIEEMNNAGVEVNVTPVSRRVRARGLVSAAEVESRKNAFSKKLAYIKGLSEKDQEIFKIGNKTLKQKEDVTVYYDSLTEEQWAKYKEIRDKSNKLETNSEKLDYMNSLTDEEKSIYKSGKKLMREMKQAAKERARRI